MIGLRHDLILSTIGVIIRNHEFIYQRKILIMAKSNTRNGEVREIWPITQFSWISPNPNEGALGWGRPVKDEKLKPTRRRGPLVRRGSDCTLITLTGKSRKDCTMAEAVSMGA